MIVGGQRVVVDACAIDTRTAFHGLVFHNSRSDWSVSNSALERGRWRAAIHDLTFHNSRFERSVNNTALERDRRLGWATRSPTSSFN